MTCRRTDLVSELVVVARRAKTRARAYHLSHQHWHWLKSPQRLRHSACPSVSDGDLPHRLPCSSLPVLPATTTTHPGSLTAQAVIFFQTSGGFEIMSKSEHVRQLKQRHSSTAWWARQLAEHPLGIVPIPTAARMLRVTPQRVKALIEQGRLRVVEDMPGGNSRDRFIPFVDLLDAPFAMTRGSPGVFGPQNRPKRHLEKKMHEHANQLAAKGLGQR